MFTVARSYAAYLSTRNGSDDLQRTLQILKVSEEAGEVADAWIGLMGQNPRKGSYGSVSDVAKELGDVTFTALVAIAGLGLDPEEVLYQTTCKVKDLLQAQGVEE